MTLLLGARECDTIPIWFVGWMDGWFVGTFSILPQYFNLSYRLYNSILSTYIHTYGATCPFSIPKSLALRHCISHFISYTILSSNRLLSNEFIWQICHPVGRPFLTHTTTTLSSNASPLFPPPTAAVNIVCSSTAE